MFDGIREIFEAIAEYFWEFVDGIKTMFKE